MATTSIVWRGGARGCPRNSYSFWGVARVAHSTIKGQFDKVSEKSYHWMRLVSFSLDPEDHEAAREELSGGPELPLAEEEEAAEEASEPAAKPPPHRLTWRNRHSFVNEIRAELQEERRTEKLYELFGSDSDSDS